MAVAPTPGSAAWYQSRALPVVKKPPAAPKPPGAADRYNAVPKIAGLTVAQIQGMTPQQIALYGASVQSNGPDYSAVPRVDFTKLRESAWKQAGTQVADQAKPYEAERTRLAANTATAKQAATGFAAAFASIAGGGNANIDDPAAQKYALENFGGSYVGAMAATLGQRLIGQANASFTEQDAKYAAQIMQIMDARPDLAEKIYSEVADDAARQIKEGRSVAEMSFKNKLGAIAALGKAMAGTADGMKVRTQSLPGGGVLGYDPQTGKVIYEIPGKGGTTSGGTASPNNVTKTKTYNGKQGLGVYQWNPASNKFDIWMGPTGSTTSSGAAPQKAIPYEVKAIGERAVEKVTDKIWALTPGTTIPADWDAQLNGKYVDSPQYQKAVAAYNAWLDSGQSFKSAMTKVIQAIGPSLKKSGFTSAQVKEAAYRIVAAEMDPPKGYKVPTAKNVSYSVDIVTPKTGIVTSKAWKGTHVTDNLNWNGGAKTAVDIMARPGTPVGAPEDGTVVRWGSAQGGQALYFQGRSGKLYWLGHIDSMAPVGTVVRSGQRIALISADHAAPHLHIDVTGGTV